MNVVELRAGEPGGPLVVFAHGLEDTWESWRALASRVDPRWRVIALDLPWRPGNDYGWRHRPAGAWLSDALDLIDAPADAIVAHSFGANAALELMCARDRRCGRAAVLVCPMYCSPDLSITWEVFDRSRRTFDQHIRDGIHVRLGRRIGRLDPEIVELMTAKTLNRVGPAGFLAVFEQFTASARLDLEDADLPTLVLAGGADPTLSSKRAHALAARLPLAELRFHEEYDHFCHVRRAPELAEQVQRYVREALANKGAIA